MGSIDNVVDVMKEKSKIKICAYCLDKIGPGEGVVSKGNQDFCNDYCKQMYTED